MKADEPLETLDEQECLRLLGQAKIGRVAVNVSAMPAIFPVNFVVDGDSVVFRTGAGTKLEAATAHAVVAFECDGVDPLEHAGWSVMVIGKAELVSRPEELARADRLPLVPWAKGARSSFVRIPLEIISGRRIAHPDGHPAPGAMSSSSEPV